MGKFYNPRHEVLGSGINVDFQNCLVSRISAAGGEFGIILCNLSGSLVNDTLSISTKRR